MSKLIAGLGGLMLALAIPAGAGATALGPAASVCDQGEGPAVLVHIEGLKSRTGVLRVQSYGGDPNAYFDKGTYLRRIDLRPPATGPIEVCVPVPAAGVYAIYARHDADGSGNTGMSDGAGMSGNPRMSLMDVLSKRKPEPKVVQVVVKGVTPIRVVMNYVQGFSFKPLSMATR